MTAASLTTRFAAALLPPTMRERYREQWLADVADAREAGVHPAQIAVGALAFAATYDRPLRVRTVNVDRRARLASGLGLAAALVSVSGYATAAGTFGGLTEIGVFDYAVFITTALLVVVATIAPIAAVVLVSVTRGMPSRVRVAVWLLAAATLAPIVQTVIDNALNWAGNAYLTLGNLAYPFAVALIVTAVVLLTREFSPRPRGHTERAAAAVGALAVLALAAIGIVAFGFLWATREPVSAEMLASPYITAEWLAAEAGAEQQVLTTWLGVGLGSIVLSMVIAASGWSRRLPAWTTKVLSAGVAFTVLIVFGAFFTFGELLLNLLGSGALVTVLLIVGRWGIVLTVLFSLGGLRLARRRAEASVPLRR